MPYTATLQLRAKVQPSIKFKAKVQPNIKIKAQGLGEMISVRVSLSSTTFLNRGAVAFSPYSLFTFGTEGVWFDPSDTANLDWRRNLLTYTEQFTNSYWALFRAALTGTRITAPDGTLTATPFTPTANSAIIQPTSGVTGVVGTQYTYSIYAKKAAQDWVYIDLYDGTFPFAFFNLNTGATGSKSAGVTSSITAVGDGFFRCTITATSAGTTIYPRTFATASDTGLKEPSITASGVVTHYIWGAQFEAGTVATEYQRITNLNTEVLERFPNTTLYQDSIGTTAVTTPGQTVGLMLDKSKGLVLGSELVANGDFATDTWWTKSGITIFGGTANWSANPNGDGLVRFTLLTTNTVYRITWTITSVSSGGLRLHDGSTFGPTRSAPGTYTETLRAAGPNFYVLSTGASTTASIDNISIKEIPGNHATQATLAARPTYAIEPAGGRRNLLTWTEDFSNVVWEKIGVTISADAVSAPDGTTTADKIVETATNGSHSPYRLIPLSAATHTYSVYLKKAERDWAYVRLAIVTGQGAYFNLSAGTVGTVESGMTASIQDVGNGWYRCRVSITTTATSWYPQHGPTTGDNVSSYVGVSGNGIYAWGAQLEVSSTATPYQRVTTQYDVTEAGKPTMSYLYFDGVNDSMVTSTITPGTDKAQVFSGMRTNSNGGLIFAELSTNSFTNAGSFLIGSGSWVQGGNRIGGGVTGSTLLGYDSPATFTFPLTATATHLYDIAGATASAEVALRINGAVQSLSYGGTGAAGTGNFLAYPLYIGGRAGSSLFFTGHLYSLITRFGATLDTPSITSTESWVASKTGFYSPVITGVPTVGVS